MLRLMLCAAAAWLVSGAPAARADAEDKVLAAIKKVGGRVYRGDGRPGTPVARVNLYCRDLTDFDLKALAAFKGLTSLSLAWSTAADAELKAVSSLAGLTDLDLHSTEVKELATLKSLTSLKLKDTKTTDAGVKELQKALPKCKVEK